MTSVSKNLFFILVLLVLIGCDSSTWGDNHNVPVANNIRITTSEDSAVDVNMSGYDLDGDTLSYRTISLPSHGTLNGTVYTPESDFYGVDTFSYVANDGTTDSDVATVQIEIVSVNDKPTTSDINITINEDEPRYIDMSGEDVDGDDLTYTIVTSPANGSIKGTLYTPKSNFSGVDTFTYVANDGVENSEPSTVTISILAANDIPTVDDINITTDEDSALRISFIGSDIDGDELTYSYTQPAHGSFDGIRYTPATNYYGTDSFTYVANDGTSDSQKATVKITIEPVNDSPIAEDINITTAEDTSVSIHLLGTDVENDNLIYRITTSPKHGVFDGTTYTPNKDYNGIDSFSYIANDGSSDSNTAIVKIKIDSTNDKPQARDVNISTDRNMPIDIQLPGYDADGDPLTFEYTEPEHGEYNGTTYIPNNDFKGIDSFIYSVDDGKIKSDTAQVTITVNSVPSANDINLTLNEDESINVVMSGNDPDGDELDFNYTQPTHGSFDGNIYTPDANFFGIDSFTYIASDGVLKSNEAIVSIVINSVNDVPSANDINISTDEDTPIAVSLSGIDADNDNLTYHIVAPPSHGSFDGNRYTPNINFYGTDMFTYTANDGTVESSEANVIIIVNAMNDAPMAKDINISVSKNKEANITLSASDIDNGNLTYEIIDNPSHGTLSGAAPSIIYTPDENFTGLDSFTYKANDSTVDSAPASVSLNVVGNLLSLGGKITYDNVPAYPHESGSYGLDHNSTFQKPARGVTVVLLDKNNNTIDTTNTDSNGSYSFSGIEESTEVKIRVLAKMVTSGAPSWDVRVVDNTSQGALYALDGILASIIDSNQTRDLNAPSGWSDGNYTDTRSAAPFAILDDIYMAMQTILDVDHETVFPPLIVNWSPKNKPFDGDSSLGEIGTSYYTNGNLFILGDADSDTDEYDNHVIAHEWGHYYEDEFSRADSDGGLHGYGDMLDIRVALSEGWGNAFSAIALRDPIYFDTYGEGQSTGWEMDMDSGPSDNPGWFSEASVQHIIYDIWDMDEEEENNDTLSLGFEPIHNAMLGRERNTTAFTSIFSFIKSLKDDNPDISEALDNIVANESIAPIDDIYGGLTSESNRTNHAEYYPYHRLDTDGVPIQVFTTNRYGSGNKLGNNAYAKFNIASDSSYHIKVEQTNDDHSDPDFVIYSLVPFSSVAYGEHSSSSVEEGDFSLEAGEYILDIVDYNNIEYAEYNITITQQ